jgi:hypothetical protein
MNDILSFYFDGALIQAAKVRVTGDSGVVTDAKSFPLDELDGYLAECREKTCVVCCNPPFFYQDIIHLPPSAEKLYGKLVRSEVQNAHPDLTSFSIFHSTVGESTIESKLYSKIAAFSYPDEFISPLLQAVNRYGITISHSYPAPVAIFGLALTACDSDQARICMATLPGEKLLLVCENNKLAFIRKIPSLSSVMLSEDAQNINMTVDYCLQTLRVRPFEAIILNMDELSGDLSSLVSVPLRSVLLPQLRDLPPSMIREYLAPIAAALHSVKSPRIGNILPSDYATFCKHKKLLSVTAKLICALVLLLGGYLVKELMTISELKSKIGRARIELSGAANELATFRTLDEEVSRLKQPLDVVNKHNITLNPAAALAALALPVSGEYVIKGATVQSGVNGLDVQLQGVINASIYSDTQALYENLVARIAKLPGYSVASSSIDIRQKTFSIQARYNSGGKPAK